MPISNAPCIHVCVKEACYLELAEAAHYPIKPSISISNTRLSSRAQLKRASAE